MEIDGFEIGIAGQINEQNSINFGLTSVDATASAGTGKVKEVPELTWSLWYTHQANDLFGLSFGAIYQDEQIIKSEGGPLLPDFTRIDMAMTLTPTETDTVRINIGQFPRRGQQLLAIRGKMLVSTFPWQQLLE